MIGILELNDAGLLLSADGAELLESPGYAAFEGRTTHFGEAAAQRVKLIPTQSHYAFWDRFSREPLRTPGPVPGQTQADLVYAHLQWLWNIVGKDLKELLIAVPGDWQREQLALLLGICQSLKLPVRALLATPLAASAGPQPGRRLMHLDLHLHRCVLSTLEQGPWLTVKDAQETHEVGLLRLLDSWSEAAANAFVQATRFDPLHQATTEQQLFDRMPAWMAAVDSNQRLAHTVNLSLDNGGQTMEISAPGQIFVDAAEPVMNRLLAFVAEGLPPGRPVTLQVGHRLSHLPGAVEALSALPDVEVVPLDRLACAGALKRLYLPRDAGRDGNAVNVTRLPWFQSSQVEVHEQGLASYRRRAPTHLLHQSMAYPLKGAEFKVGTAASGGAGISLNGQPPGVAERHFRLRDEDGEWIVEDLSGGATEVNGEAFEGRRTVTVGDRIRIGRPAQEFLLIAEAKTEVEAGS
ncbi:MAG: FHA domain-containing protein [Pseudomonadota bacterium]